MKFIDGPTRAAVPSLPVQHLRVTPCRISRRAATGAEFRHSHRQAFQRLPQPHVFRQHAAAPLKRRQLVCRAAEQVLSEGDGSGRVFTATFLRVVLPTALALLLCNMDRICMSVAIVPMAKEYGWSLGTQGVVQSAFLWGYMATPLLGGALADRYGGKVVMAWGVLWFSLASLLLPIASSPAVAALGLTLPAVMLARVFVGVGEGVALPCMNNLVAANIPPARRATALGTAFTGFHTGNLVGLVLSPLLLAAYGWRALFYTFGIMGAPLLLIWQLVVPNAAPSAARVQPAGAGTGKAAAPAGLLQLLSSTATWAIIIVNFVNHWGYFIYLNWLPSYFVKVLGVDLRSSSFMSLVPWVVMAVGSSAAGWLADGLMVRGMPVTNVRKIMQTVAFLGPAVALLVLANPNTSPSYALALLTCALGMTSLGQAGFVANMSDIAPKQAGQMFGLCNTFGCFAGILGVSAVGFIVQRAGSFDPVFKLTAVMYVVASVVWNLWCTGERVF